MNYYIEKHDMEIILDALELLGHKIKSGKTYAYSPTAVHYLVGYLMRIGQND